MKRTGVRVTEEQHEWVHEREKYTFSGILRDAIEELMEEEYE